MSHRWITVISRILRDSWRLWTKYTEAVERDIRLITHFLVIFVKLSWDLPCIRLISWHKGYIDNHPWSIKISLVIEDTIIEEINLLHERDI